MILSMSGRLGGLVVWNGHRIDRTDRSRLAAESALHRRARAARLRSTRVPRSRGLGCTRHQERSTQRQIF
jgi:hypothetical protein